LNIPRQYLSPTYIQLEREGDAAGDTHPLRCRKDAAHASIVKDNIALPIRFFSSISMKKSRVTMAI